MKNIVKLAHFISALHDPWCHFYFWFLTGMSSWVPSRTQGFVPTCCRLWCILATARVGWLLPLWRSVNMGMIHLIYLVSKAFVGSQPWYWHVFEIRLMLVSNYFASTTFQLSCNNYVELRYILDYLWNGCNMWLVMLNHYNLGLYVGCFEIPHDFIGLSELYGLKCENLITPVIVFVLVLL
jgi:hypothetical protein